jgi:heme exporter protein A
LLRPTRGTALVGGHDCVRAAESARAILGVVAHGAHVYEDLTARENLAFWVRMAGQPADADTLAAALADVDLERHAHARVRTFSAGMRRRLALARLGLARPRVMLLDEPFAGLDQRARKWLEGRLESFKAGGGALLMATHSFGRELGIADRLAVLAGGRVVLESPRAGLDAQDVQRLYAAHTEDAS